MKKPSRQLLAVPVLLAVAMLAAACQGGNVPYVSTPEAMVQKMLRMARVGPGDVVYDLGSGDGRIVIAAVRDFKATRAVGIDIDPDRIIESLQNAEGAGVTERTNFLQKDVFEADFSEATVLTMYLLPRFNLRLRPRIFSELKPGSRVVSHQFSMGDWEPDETARIGTQAAYLWIVPARVGGAWRTTLDGQDFRIELTQRHQKIAGAMHADPGGASVRLEDATLAGNRLRFAAQVRRGTRTVAMRLDGRVEGATLTGELTVDGRASRVEAVRID